MGILLGTLLLAGFAFPAWAQGVAVFAEPGFPVVESEPVPHAALVSALGAQARFLNLAELRAPGALAGISLLVLPYGSAVPAPAWPQIAAYLQGGGNLLLVGGEPLRVPVDGTGPFTMRAPQDSYSRALGWKHSYELPPVAAQTRFTWREGLGLPPLIVHARTVFAEEGKLDGLGYLQTPDGTRVSAPVIVADRDSGARVVALPFTPEPGYWGSPDGVRLLRAAAEYAAAGARSFLLETKYAVLRPGEVPELALHLRAARAVAGSVRAELLSQGKMLETATFPLSGDAPLLFRKPLPEGVYTVRATWTPDGDGPGEFSANGFTVEHEGALANGPALGVRGDFLQLGGKPFLPVGTNYFTTEENGWDFSGPRNGAVWEHDFADMERHGVRWVRTGVWFGQNKALNPATGEANERFLRNLEGYLAAAHRHGIVVNFTFFAFSPDTTGAHPKTGDPTTANPYLDSAAVAAEQKYAASVVRRFHDVPWLCWDLINEPSFSNPRAIFHGNVPNGDGAELLAWQGWLHEQYGTLPALADAWRVTPESLGDWNRIPLPQPKDLQYDRYGNADEVRALDYNLFAQAMFTRWTRGMVDAIRSAGSTQLVNVGQDEGGVTDRLLNQFYATAGVAFTTNHTYWQDEALLWDSLAAKRPGMPNITGETGYQPAWNLDGSWRYDELTGTALEERKWALGFAAGSSGAVQWDWAREVDFGMQRSDGSAKVWEGMMAAMGRFAAAAAPYATGLTQPEVAIVLPQSLQVSALKDEALQAQQTAVRVLYGYNRVEAYAVGEYQIDTLGTPKLIVLPSPYGLDEKAWTAIEARVRAGAVLLVSGPFSADPHLHETDRAQKLGMPYQLAPLQGSSEPVETPAGRLWLAYGDKETTMLDKALLPDGSTWAHMPLGKGEVLFSPLPLELNGNLQAVAQVYALAMARARVGRTYTTATRDPALLICPTRLPKATLYVLASETEASPIDFTDARSGKRFAGTLGAGRAALLLVGAKGELLAEYGWNGTR